MDRLKYVGDVLAVSIAQYGDLHLQVSTSLVTVGSELRKLRVLGVRGTRMSSYLIHLIFSCQCNGCSWFSYFLVPFSWSPDWWPKLKRFDTHKSGNSERRSAFCGTKSTRNLMHSDFLSPSLASISPCVSCVNHSKWAWSTLLGVCIVTWLNQTVLSMVRTSARFYSLFVCCALDLLDVCLWVVCRYCSTGCLLDSDIPVLRSRHSAVR